MPYRISRLGLVEIRSLDLDRDLDYYINVLGLQLTAREGKTAYMKGWDERHAYSFALTESDRAGMVRMALLRLPGAVVAMAVTVAGTDLLLRVSDEMSRAVLGGFRDDVESSTQMPCPSGRSSESRLCSARSASARGSTTSGTFWFCSQACRKSGS